MLGQHLTVVVVTWNGADLLDACLDALAAQTAPAAEVVVVDNGSTDDTMAVLSRHRARVVPLATNVGFAAGVNAGVATAKTEWVVLLNNDAVPHPTWLAELGAAIGRAGSAVGYLASTLLLAATDLVDSAGDELDRAFVALPRGHGLPEAALEPPRSGFVLACGGAAAYRVAMWRELGGMAESFFAYLEDADLSLRARQAGWVGEWVPGARVAHVHSATSARLPGFKTYQCVRNSWFLFVRCVPRELLWRALPLHVLSHLVWLASGLRRGEVLPVLRAWRDGLRALPRLRRERKEIQAASIVAPQALWADLLPARELHRIGRS